MIAPPFQLFPLPHKIVPFNNGFFALDDILTNILRHPEHSSHLPFQPFQPVQPLQPLLFIMT